MNDLPKFIYNSPKNKEEKLIVELIEDLDSTTHAFIKLNNPGNITNETFIILRDASIGYCGGMIRDLAKLLSDKNEVNLFIVEAKKIFDSYIEQLIRNLKCSIN